MRFDCDVTTDNLIDGRLVSLRCDFSNEKFKTFRSKTFNNINNLICQLQMALANIYNWFYKLRKDKRKYFVSNF